MSFAIKWLGFSPDATAPDGSEVRQPGAFALPPHAV
jgi:hypothetical protein